MNAIGEKLLSHASIVSASFIDARHLQQKFSPFLKFWLIVQMIKLLQVVKCSLQNKSVVMNASYCDCSVVEKDWHNPFDNKSFRVWGLLKKSWSLEHFLLKTFYFTIKFFFNSFKSSLHLFSRLVMGHINITEERYRLSNNISRGNQLVIEVFETIEGDKLHFVSRNEDFEDHVPTTSIMEKKF